jgi:hypothetical protein
MGLLDDAIREHLDLKRRRGADPGEIAREENEALGPVRRSEPEAEAAHAGEGPYADEHAAAPAPDYEDDERGRDQPAQPAEEPHTHDAPYAESESETATPPHGDPLLHQQTREFSADELDEALGQPEPEPEQQPPPPAERPGEPGGDTPEGEDVLEETPDFLQETPEHDRLWFEQKPPKDFDF